MISWNEPSTVGLRIESTILLRLPKRITIILTLRITLEKRKQLRMEYIHYYRERKTLLRRQIYWWNGDNWPSRAQQCISQVFTEIGPNLASQINPPSSQRSQFCWTLWQHFRARTTYLDELRKLVKDTLVGKAIYLFSYFHWNHS